MQPHGDFGVHQPQSPRHVKAHVAQLVGCVQPFGRQTAQDHVLQVVLGRCRNQVVLHPHALQQFTGSIRVKQAFLQVGCQKRVHILVEPAELPRPLTHCYQVGEPVQLQGLPEGFRPSDRDLPAGAGDLGKLAPAAGVGFGGGERGCAFGVAQGKVPGRSKGNQDGAKEGPSPLPRRRGLVQGGQPPGCEGAQAAPAVSHDPGVPGLQVPGVAVFAQT